MSNNALNRLLQDKVEGSSETYSSIAMRANMPRSTVHKLATKPLAALPKMETLEKLAVGLDIPVDVVIRAAQEAAGYHLYEETFPDADTVLLISNIEQLTPGQRAAVSALVSNLLRTTD